MFSPQANSFADGDEVTEASFPHCGGMKITKPNMKEAIFNLAPWEFAPDDTTTPGPTAVNLPQLDAEDDLD